MQELVTSKLAKLVFPEVCGYCNRILVQSENHLCYNCESNLGFTRFHHQADNPVSKLFWGRVQIAHATAFFTFVKGGISQHILHEIKYHGNQAMAHRMGFKFGVHLHESDFYRDIDCIVPVPLHPKRLKWRGYNQSQRIAEGLSECMEIPVDTSSLYREVANSTQTKKSKYDRWLNVEYIFKLQANHNLASKHVLLVDDVITTGATIEACCAALQEAPNIKISIACLAMA